MLHWRTHGGLHLKSHLRQDLGVRLTKVLVPWRLGLRHRQCVRLLHLVVLKSVGRCPTVDCGHGDLHTCLSETQASGAALVEQATIIEIPNIKDCTIQPKDVIRTAD